jgi:hypothetical protein
MTTEQTPATSAAAAPLAKESKLKSFFDHIGEWFEGMGKSGNWEHKAALAVAVVRPLVIELVTLAAGTKAADKVSGVATQVGTDLNDAEAILTGAETTGKITLSGALTSIQVNLGKLLTDADIKNSEKASEITQAATTILGEVQAIAEAVPADHSTPVTGTAKPATAAA